MAVLGRLTVYRVRQVQLPHYDTGSKIKVLPDDVDQLVGGSARCAVALDEYRQWFGDSDGVG